METLSMKSTTTLGALMLLAFSLSLAQGTMDQPPRAAGPDGRVLRQLKLTEDQQKSIGALRLELQKKIVGQQARIKTSRLELTELFRADQPNQSAIEKKISEITQLQSEQKLMVVNQWFSVNKLLTPEQQKVWKKASGQFLAQRRGQFMRGRTAMMRNQRNWARRPANSEPMGR
jgi:Spy/CpxP family protein refolding chaperone